MERHRTLPARSLLTALAASSFLALPADTARGAVVTSADLQVTKTRTSPSPAHPGEVIGYDILVTNNGPDAAVNAVLTDVVPPNTTFDEGGIQTAPGWNCTLPAAGGTGTMTCTTASFAAGASADFYMEAAVDQGKLIPVSIENTATVSSDTPDPATGNDASAISTDVSPAPPPPVVPVLSGRALAGLAAAVALAGLYLLRR